MKQMFFRLIILLFSVKLLTEKRNVKITNDTNSSRHIQLIFNKKGKKSKFILNFFLHMYGRYTPMYMIHAVLPIK